MMLVLMVFLMVQAALVWLLIKGVKWLFRMMEEQPEKVKEAYKTVAPLFRPKAESKEA